MKIDKNLINSLLTLDDDKLYRTVELLAATSGCDLKKLSDKPKSIEGLRALMTTLTDEDIARAYELADIYKAAQKRRS